MSRVPPMQKLQLVLVGLIGGIMLGVPLIAVASDDASDLEERIADLEATLSGVVRDGDTLAFEAMNLQIVNGIGATESSNGLGNLIIGYSEDASGDADRSGSHYVVVGDENEWSAHAGLLVGRRHSASGPYAAVVGGSYNTVSGKHAALIGGYLNTASGSYASVSGGTYNLAAGAGSSVSGGHRATAEQYVSAVSGGIRNTAGGVGSSVSGGVSNSADGYLSSILGGDGVTVTDRFGHWPR